MKRLIVFACMIAMMGCGSSRQTTRKIAVSEVAGLMKESRTTFEKDCDLEISELGLGANLKLLEAMSVHHPTQEELNLFLAEGFTMYALAFVEDKMEEFEESNEELSVHHQKRAIALYLRGKEFAGRVLHPLLEVKDLENISDKGLEKKLKGLDKDDVPAIFWYAFSWGSSMNIDRENMDAFSQISKIEIMMQRVEELDPGFFFGGAWLFRAIYYGGRSKDLGGKPEVSKEYFEKAAAKFDRKFLIVPYFYAKTYCVQFQDKKCFDDNVKHVLEAPRDIMPEQCLANEFAKKKTRRLAKKREELFID